MSNNDEDETEIDDLSIVGKVHTPSHHTAMEIAEMWARKDFIVEVKPPSMIANDEWCVEKKEWAYDR